MLLVRHGESEPADPRQPFPLVDGRGDPGLSPEGVTQAERLADRLASLDVAAVYITPLRRTRETAAPLASRLGLEPHVEPGLVEVHLGAWEGGIYRERVAAGDPLALRMFEEERWDVIPGAEPNEAVAERARAALERIVARHPDELVVAVSHAGVIGMLLAELTGSRPFAFVGSDNAAVSAVVGFAGRWFLRRFNDTAHLE